MKIGRLCDGASQMTSRLRDYGTRLGKWRGKCVANAILGLCRGSMWERMRVLFLRRCANHAGAGFGGTVRERGNMETVMCALQGEGAAVLVVSAHSRQEWEAGRWTGCWWLGAQAGSLLGVLLWCGTHVYVLEDEVSGARAHDLRSDAPPWEHVIVWGKKAKGKPKSKATASQLTALAKARAQVHVRTTCGPTCPRGSVLSSGARKLKVNRRQRRLRPSLRL